MAYDDDHNGGSLRVSPHEDAPRRPKGSLSDEEQSRFDDIENNYGTTASAAEEDQKSAYARDVLNQERTAAKGNFGGSIGSAGSASGQSGSTDVASEQEEETQSSRFRQEESAGLYRQEPTKKKANPIKIGKMAFSRARAGGLLAGIIASIAGVIAGFISWLIPFQVPSLTQLIEDRMYAAVQNAVEETGERMFTSYLYHVVLPSLTEGPDSPCPSTKVARGCVNNIQGDNVVVAQFKRWAGLESTGQKVQRLELMLAEGPNGFEIQRSGNKSYVRSASLGNQVSLDEVAEGKVSNIFEMQELNKTQASRELKRAMKDQFQDRNPIMAKWLRYRGGRALQTKFGIVRCLADCQFKDAKDRAINKLTLKDQQKMGMAWFFRRVIEPHSVMAATALNCLMNPCDDEIKSDGLDESDLTNGEPMDEYRKESRRILREFAHKYNQDKLEDLVKVVNDVNARGMSAAMTKLIVEKMGGSVDAGRISSDFVQKLAGPVAWVITIARIVEVVYNGVQLKTFVYTMNAAGYVQMFELYRTTAHEMKAHHTSAAAAGSSASMLNNGTHGEGITATGSPQYDQFFDGPARAPAAAFMRSVLPQKAYAAGTAADAEANTYKCDDGKPIHAHAISAGNPMNAACPKERLVFNNVITELSEFFRAIPGLGLLLDVVGPILDLIDGVADIGGAVVEAGLRALGLGGLIDSMVQLVTESLFPWLAHELLPFVFDEGDAHKGLDGARVVNGLLGGGDVGANYLAHRNLGGKRLTNQEVTEIVRAEEAERLDNFATLPLRERLFAADNAYSLTGQLALSIPGSTTGMAQSTFANLLGNPLSTLANSFGSIFSLRKANAQPYTGSAIGVTQYGYPSTSPVFADDEDLLNFYHEQCGEGRAAKIGKAYNTDKSKSGDETDPEMRRLVQEYGWVINPDTNEPENDKENPCFLIESVANHDQDPPAPAVQGGGDQPAPGGGIPGATCNSIQACAQALLALEGSKLVIRPPAKTDLQQAAAGRPLNMCSRPQLNLTLLQLLNQLSAKYNMRLNFFLTGRSSCGDGFHPPGRAVDVDGINGTEMNGFRDFSNPVMKQFGRDVMSALPAGGGLGQKTDYGGNVCFGDIGSTAGKRYFPDGCDHIHIDVGASAP